MGPIATRRERVVLELDDQFTAGILRAAAATKLADKAMDDFGGTNLRTNRTLDVGATWANKQAKSLESLDRSALRAERSGSLLVDSLVGLGPALLPIGAVAVPAVAGLAAQLGFAAAGAGVALIAFKGVGDALKAMDAAQLEPTAANLTKMDQAMQALGPSGREFVRQLDALEPKLKSIKRSAESGLLPGVTDGIDALLTRLPQVRHIIAEISETMGDLSREAGQGLAGDKFSAFFDYLQNNAQPILTDLGRTVGNLSLGLANLFVATAPQQRDFSDWLLSVSRGFAEWSAKAGESKGFQDFMDFVEQSGPQVAAALGSIGNALVQVAQAGAPLSGPVLKGLGVVADLIARIADSPIGTPLVVLASGLALVNRALATRDLARGSTLGQLIAGRTERIERSRASVRGLAADIKAANSFGAGGGFAGTRALASSAELENQAAAAGRLNTRMASLGKSAAVVGGLAFATSGLADKMGEANTASYALLGTMGGPFGVAAGAAFGQVMDLKAANDALAASAKAATAVFKDQNSTLTQQKAALSDLKDQAEPYQKSFKNFGASLVPAQLTKRLYGVVSGNAGDVADAYQAGLNRIRTDKAQREMSALTTQAILTGQGFTRTAAGARELADGVNGMTRSLTRGREALNLAGNVDAYKAALDDLRGALRTNGRTLDANTEKGRANRASLRNIASTALSVADGLRGVGKVRFLDRARSDFIAAATAAGMTRAAAKRLADQFGLLDRLNPKVKVTVDGVLTAKANVAQLINALTGLHDKTIRINTVTTNSKTPMAAGYADGGFVSGPGGPREDKVRALLSNGEFVVNASATQRFRRELEWMNARRYANGGAVGRTTASLQPMTLPAIAVSVGTDLNGHITATAEYVVDRTLAGRDSMTTAASVAAGPSIPGGWD